MLEDIEGLSSSAEEGIRTTDFTPAELDYIRECVDPPRPETLAERIDEIQDCLPPKAIDSNPQIAEMISPMKDEIPPEYLEAPDDIEQIEQISDMMENMEELRPEKWEKLTPEQRVLVLNQLEVNIAYIEHRPPCLLQIKDLGDLKETEDGIRGHMGFHEKNPLNGERIVINSKLVESGNPKYLMEALDTVIHEGRHSYQMYNLEDREIHTDKESLTQWKNNMQEGYKDVATYGMATYWIQPVEVDARVFAYNVLKTYKDKL